jgi:hypothetical protein
MKSPAIPTTLALALLAAPLAYAQLVINEIDADQAGGDTDEFIELYDGGTGNTALDGLVVVLYNGSDDQSYAAYDLDGFSTDANGFFLLGNTNVSGAAITLPSDGIQNGADAVALFTGNDTDFPNDTAITTTGLIDVIVYGSNDSDDIGLLNGFGETTQYNDSTTESVARVPDGTGGFASKLPSPGASNGVPDTTAPSIDTLDPADDAIDVPVYTDLVVTFDENIEAVSGNITLHLQSDNSTVETYDVTADVSISGDTLTIDTFSNLTPSTGYYVTIPGAALQDTSGNPYGGTPDSTTWSFTTAAPDMTAPTISGVSPADDSTDASPSTNLVITFDEPVQLGIVSELTIRLFSDDTEFETVDLFSNASFPGGAISGTELTVDPVNLMDYSTAYYVEIAAGAVEDLAGNPLVAVSGNSTWNFTTMDEPAPADVVISQYYEGTSFNKWLELRNNTASPVTLTDYVLTYWNNTNTEEWRNGGTPNASLDLSAVTIPANGYYLLSHADATTPGYAVANDTNSSVINFNGDDSMVLFLDADQSGTYTTAEIVDAVSFTDAGNEGANTSFSRISNGVGYSLTAGDTILAYLGSTWEQKTNAEVDSATPGVDLFALESAAGATAPSLDDFTVADDLASTATPFVELNITWSSGTPTEYRVSEVSDFSDTTWQSFSSFLSYGLSAGTATKTVYLQLRNAAGESGVLSDTIDYSTYTWPGDVMFTQYHEAGNPNRYVEITNTSGSAIDLADYSVVLFSNSNTENWKIAGAGAGGSVSLAGITLNAGETMLLATTGATTPIDSSLFTSPDLAGALFINGNDSVALYNDADQSGTYESAELVDVFSFTEGGAEGAATGFVRISETQGFDFTPGTTILDSGAVWQQITTATADAAVPTDNEYLGTYPGGTMANDFAAWLTTNGYSASGFDDDSLDSDGDTAGVEWYFFGSNPDVASGNGSEVSAVTSTGPGTFTFTHRRPTARNGITETYQYSFNLDGTWNPSDANVDIQVTGTTPDGPDYEIATVTVTVTPGTTANVFVRLEIAEEAPM